MPYHHATYLQRASTLNRYADFWAANCTKKAFGGHLLGSYSAAPDALAVIRGREREWTEKGKVRNREGRDKKDVKG